MKILAVDIGTGTQDIFLFDSRLTVENGFKLVMPSPTMMVHRKMRQAAREGRPILLSGVTMGGGPSQWATEAHLRANLPVFATPEAARSFNDDLSEVQAMGVRIIGEEEAAKLPERVLRLELADFNFKLIQKTFAGFGISLTDLDAVAVAVFDHGAAPPQVSDRQFRFDYLDERIRLENRLSAFAYPADEIPPFMTRMLAVSQSAQNVPARLFLMDTAPAAVLGALCDPVVAGRRRLIVANVGNFHTLAFRLGPSGIEGMFEHHTGLINRLKLDQLLQRLADGTLTHAEVFADHGHGALIYEACPLPLDQPDFNVVVTGPRRTMLWESVCKPYFAVPFGDMMIAGCFGLLRALADLVPDWQEEILSALRTDREMGVSPWDI